MGYTINIIDWYAISLGLADKTAWYEWARQDHNNAWSGELPATPLLPKMSARRMSTPSKLATQAALTLIEQHSIDAAIFISQHGELERSYKIIESICLKYDVSPTDFSMSVHNTAAGLVSIIGKQTFPISSLAAGRDGFQQALLETYALLQTDNIKNVLVVDFDGDIPKAYQTQYPQYTPAYACAYVITQGDTLSCSQQPTGNNTTLSILPQSLQLLRNMLRQDASFMINGTHSNWLWTQ
ncbi:beta-ketoacyl synthase chain length factor [Neisseria sp. Ec49-e6-T10]|uniref:beta-ketoacyl synthase chain length factor n=1 Tax=Neisseria sp. Ec49-e6-T10 TaxID=3140744 RepID=UPI003EB7B410